MNITESYTITHDSGKFEMTALVSNDGTYTSPWLLFLDKGKEVDSWDNPEFLYNRLYNHVIGKAFDKELHDDLKKLNVSLEELQEVFDRAIEIGFFVNVEKKDEPLIVNGVLIKGWLVGENGVPYEE